MPFWWQRWALSCAEGWLCIDHSDIMLPGMDGWQILQTLRTAKKPLLFALLQGILSMTESEGWQWSKWLSGKTFFIFWVAGKVRAQLRQHHALNSTLEISGLEWTLLVKVWAGTISVLHWRAGVSVTLATGLQSWRNYTQNVIASEIWGINFDSDTNTVDVPFAGSAQKLMILFLKS